MICAYCEKDMRPMEKRLYKHGEYFHAECFAAHVHDVVLAAILSLEHVVDSTQNTNSAANSRTRSVITLLEKIK